MLQLGRMIRERDLLVPDRKIIRAGLLMKPRHNVCVVLMRHGKIIDVIFGKNCVTNEGDKWYAQEACGESATYTFANLILSTSHSGTPAKDDDYSDLTGAIGASSKAKSATYPKTNDGDSDNTGAGVDIVSWLFEYTGGDGNWSSITHGAIIESGASGTDPLHCVFAFASSWNKDSNTSAKVFVNHQMDGDVA